MKIFKFILLATVITILTIFTWTIGSGIGNWITRTSPPTVAHPELSALYFLLVCLFNSFLITTLIRMARPLNGYKSLPLTVYVFAVQFFLTQLETLFFSQSIGISTGQVISILIAGLVMSSITVPAGVRLSEMFFKQKDSAASGFSLKEYSWRKSILALIVLAVIVYPFLYMLFGYYVAWQHESLRVFYSGSASINSLFDQLSQSLTNGIYVYQIFRAFLWIIVTAPVVVMLRQWGVGQYVFIGMVSALLPASLLFIPNPYMPAEIAMIHFTETALSNFLWGLSITIVVNRQLQPTRRSDKILKYSGN